MGGYFYDSMRVCWRHDSAELFWFTHRWICCQLFAHFPPATLAHFFDVIFFFYMIWLFLWHVNVFNVRQKLFCILNSYWELSLSWFVLQSLLILTQIHANPEVLPKEMLKWRQLTGLERKQKYEVVYSFSSKDYTL